GSAYRTVTARVTWLFLPPSVEAIENVRWTGRLSPVIWIRRKSLAPSPRATSATARLWPTGIFAVALAIVKVPCPSSVARILLPVRAAPASTSRALARCGEYVLAVAVLIAVENALASAAVGRLDAMLARTSFGLTAAAAGATAEAVERSSPGGKSPAR